MRRTEAQSAYQHVQPHDPITMVSCDVIVLAGNYTSTHECVIDH